jgi:hypothetical protein
MNGFATRRMLQRLLSELLSLRDAALKREKSFSDELYNIAPA